MFISPSSTDLTATFRRKKKSAGELIVYRAVMKFLSIEKFLLDLEQMQLALVHIAFPVSEKNGP
jgi:hypothetical protein